MSFIPLTMILDGGRFRLPGKRAVFTKVGENGTVFIQKSLDGKQTCEVRSACLIRNSSGRTFEKDAYCMVEEI